MSKVLIVDKSIDRKKRIAALKGRGFSVFPALKLDEARSRCRPGAYDLIIVNAQDEPEMAAAFCDELRWRTPAQAVLLVVSNGSANVSAGVTLVAGRSGGAGTASGGHTGASLKCRRGKPSGKPGAYPRRVSAPRSADYVAS